MNTIHVLLYWEVYISNSKMRISVIFGENCRAVIFCIYDLKTHWLFFKRDILYVKFNSLGSLPVALMITVHSVSLKLRLHEKCKNSMHKSLIIHTQILMAIILFCDHWGKYKQNYILQRFNNSWSLYIRKWKISKLASFIMYHLKMSNFFFFFGISVALEILQCLRKAQLDRILSVWYSIPTLTLR